MRKSVIILLLCAIMLIGTVSATENGTVSCRTEDADVALGGSEQMVKTSKAVLVYERRSGMLLYGYNIDEMIYPSSMVKMMTTIVALEKGNLDDVCTVTRSALDSVAIGSVSANLIRGEEMTLRDLLYCVMVASANDACAVVAEHIAGSQEAFVALMNEKAAALGCTGTHFSNATGLHDEQTYTTTRDILRIINAGLEMEEFATMFKTPQYTVPATNCSENARVLNTTNYMLSKEVNAKYLDSRVTGGKTGATNQAGRCLAVTAEIGGMEIVAVVMGAKATYEVEGLVLSTYGSFEEMAQVLDHIEQAYELRQIFYSDQVLCQSSVSDGSNDVAVTPGENLYCVLPKGTETESLTWSYGSELQNLRAPIEKGETLSQLQVWYQNVCVAQTDLIAMNGVTEDSGYTGEKLTVDAADEDNHGKIIAIVLCSIAGVVVLVFLLIGVLNVARRAAGKANARRRRRNRRQHQGMLPKR